MSNHLVEGERRVVGKSEKIPEWLRRLDRESRERQRRIITNIDEGVEPERRRRQERNEQNR